MKRAGLILVAVATTVLGLAGSSSANHHACPVVTTYADGTVNVDRKGCMPVFVPNLIGGPKSALPPGANLTLPIPIPLPELETPAPEDLGVGEMDLLPPIDPLSDSGPDFACLRPNLGAPDDSDPPVPGPEPVNGRDDDGFPIEKVLLNGNVMLGNRQVVALPTVCAPTVVSSDGRMITILVSASIVVLAP